MVSHARASKLKKGAYCNGGACRHAIQIVSLTTQGHHFRDDSLPGPVDTEHFGELLQILCRSFSNGEYGIPEPAHAEIAQLLVKELHSQLLREERDIFDDGKSYSPLLVFCKLNNSWK